MVLLVRGLRYVPVRTLLWSSLFPRCPFSLLSLLPPLLLVLYFLWSLWYLWVFRFRGVLMALQPWRGLWFPLVPLSRQGPLSLPR